MSAGIAIFAELGFLAVEGFGTTRRIRMAASPDHMDLDSSIRYLEGKRSGEEFGRFFNWALSATADELLAHINRPIVPSTGTRARSEGE